MPDVTIPAVYRVTIQSGTKSDEGYQLAIKPHFENAEASWNDASSHGKFLNFSEIIFSGYKANNPSEESSKLSEEYEKQLPKKIVIKDTNTTYTLEFLTKELYDAHVRNYVAKKPSFTSTEKLQDFYLMQDFG